MGVTYTQTLWGIKRRMCQIYLKRVREGWAKEASKPIILRIFGKWNQQRYKEEKSAASGRRRKAAGSIRRTRRRAESFGDLRVR